MHHRGLYSPAGRWSKHNYEDLPFPHAGLSPWADLHFEAKCYRLPHFEKFFDMPPSVAGDAIRKRNRQPSMIFRVGYGRPWPSNLWMTDDDGCSCQHDQLSTDFFPRPQNFLRCFFVFLMLVMFQEDALRSSSLICISAATNESSDSLGFRCLRQRLKRSDR